jgi:hypothetical protein
MATLQTVRRWIMTGAVAAITITGTIYGAGLKGRQDVKQVCLITAYVLEPGHLRYYHPSYLCILTLIP